MNNITVCYCGTRNRYKNMAVAAASLLKHNDVGKIYMFIEDDEFPYMIDERIIPVNVSGQPYILKTSPNYNSRWTYMTCIRCVFTKFIDEDKVLYLDDDTLVVGDITELWNTDMHGNPVAAVGEPRKNPMELYMDFNTPYVNTGVLLIDLKKMKECGYDDALMDFINKERLMYPDQDAINFMLKGMITVLGPKYNSSVFTGQPYDAAIIHSTPIKPWDRRSPWFAKWTKYAESIN